MKRARATSTPSAQRPSAGARAPRPASCASSSCPPMKTACGRSCQRPSRRAASALERSCSDAPQAGGDVVEREPELRQRRDAVAAADHRPSRQARATALSGGPVRVPTAKGSSSKAPIGPFRRRHPSPHSRSPRRRRRCAAQRRGPSSRPARERRRGSRVSVSRRSSRPRSTGRAPLLVAARVRGSIPAASHSDAPTGVTLRREETGRTSRRR